MHRETSPRHGDAKLCFVRLAGRPKRLTMTWSTVLAWLALTGDSYSLIEMKTGAVANNLALVEFDLTLINTDQGL